MLNLALMCIKDSLNYFERTLDCREGIICGLCQSHVMTIIS